MFPRKIVDNPDGTKDVGHIKRTRVPVNYGVTSMYEFGGYHWLFDEYSALGDKPIPKIGQKVRVFVPKLDGGQWLYGVLRPEIRDFEIGACWRMDCPMYPGTKRWKEKGMRAWRRQIEVQWSAVWVPVGCFEIVP